MRVFMVLDGSNDEIDITNHDDGRLVVEAAEKYRLVGLTPVEFCEDLPPFEHDGNIVGSGIIHWCENAEVADDWSLVILHACWAETDFCWEC